MIEQGASQICGTEIGLIETGKSKIGAGQIGCRKTGNRRGRKSQIGAVQFCFCEIGTGEICVIERDMDQIRRGKIGVTKARMPKIAAAHRGIAARRRGELRRQSFARLAFARQSEAHAVANCMGTSRRLVVRSGQAT